MKRPASSVGFPSSFLVFVALASVLLLMLPARFTPAAEEMPADMPADKPAKAAKAPKPAKVDKAAKPVKAPKAPKAAPAAPAAASVLPSMEEIRQLHQAEKHQDVLKAMARVLTLRGPASKEYDKYELWMIKGETHLRMKTQQPALSAFREAAEVAPDDQTKAEAQATAMLIRRAKNFVYTPKARAKPAAGEKPAESIDLLDPAQRRAGFQALFDEELAGAAPKVKAAQRAKNLPEIAKAMATVAELRSLELAATGGQADTAELVESLAGRATELMKTAVGRMEKRVADIEERANKLVEYRVQVPDPLNPRLARYETRYRRRGIDDRERRELRDAVETCKQLIPAADSLAEASEPRRDELQEVVLKAEDVGRQAEDTLSADYTGEVNR